MESQDFDKSRYYNQAVSKLILFNKPYQVLSQFSLLDGKATLKDYLNGPSFKNCYPAGRLDYDSEGLLLLTDDGKLQHQIANPQKKLAKHYWVQVEGQVSDEAIQKLESGIHLKDGPCKPAKVYRIDKPRIWERTPPIRSRKQLTTEWLEIVIHEGKNRQVRRMCAAIEHPCLRLIRHKIGFWHLQDLKPGDFNISHVHLPQTSRNKSTKVKSKKRQKLD